MNDDVTFAKTPAGMREVVSREQGLPPRLRTMLIMVDGSTPAARLRQAAERLGAPADFLDNLESLGLIARVQGHGAPATPPAMASVGTTAVAPPPAALAGSTPGAAAPATPSAGDEARRFAEAKKFMNDTAVDAMGLRGVFFTLKIEKCSTRADLEALMPEYSKAVSRARDPQVAELTLARMREQLR